MGFGVYYFLHTNCSGLLSMQSPMAVVKGRAHEQPSLWSRAVSKAIVCTNTLTDGLPLINDLYAHHALALYKHT